MSYQDAHRAKSLSMRPVFILGKCFWGILTGFLFVLTMSCESVSEGITADSEPTATVVQELTSAECASGIAGDVFTNGLVGCNGAVSWANRASLCAAGYRPATAAEWMYRGGVPTHNYWTDDPLEYGGTSTACWVSYSRGNNSCGSSPMRVCTSTGTDAEGNLCNWKNCGMNSSTSNDYFGGCASNTTAGALCVPVGGCADGSVEQLFANGVVGCAGSVTVANSWTLCAPGYYLVSQSEWEAARGTTVPTHNYWVEDDIYIGGLPYWTGTGTGACQAYGSSDCGLSCTSSPYHSCPSDKPMHVCASSGTDPEGNTCSWTNCAGAEDPSTNEYYGGCSGTNDAHAGTLCAPREGCKSGRVVQHFTTAGVSPDTLVEFDACAGIQTQANAGTSLCMAGYRLATAAEWNSYRGNVAPTHDYWTSDTLKWNGTSSACWVSTTSGNSCATGKPMHVCTSTGTDPEGNTCTWANCGLDTTTPDAFFGGCSGTNDANAGALCVRPRPPPG